MPLCLCGLITLRKVEITLSLLSFCLLLFFLFLVAFAPFVSLVTLFDCSKGQILYCYSQQSFSGFLLVEAVKNNRFHILAYNPLKRL